MGPVQDITPLIMMQDGVYVGGELWDFWRETFPRSSVSHMWDFVMHDKMMNVLNLLGRLLGEGLVACLGVRLSISFP